MQEDEESDVAVFGVPDDKYGEELCAWVQTSDGSKLDEAGVKAFCKGQIAHFKVPRYWAFIKDLPRTPSERIAKHVLVGGVEDLRAGAYDRVDDTWR